MQRTPLLLAALALLAPGQIIAQQPADEQIAQAVQAAPQDMRDGATVIGYQGASKMLQIIRQGTNDLVCHSDNPDQEGVTVACYHVSLEPFMERGRELNAEGITGGERQRTRIQEATEGKLKMPDQAAVLLIVNADDGSWSGEAFDGASRRMVVYVPGATPETLGISGTPGPGAPWIMFPGTPAAHIMIPSFP